MYFNSRRPGGQGMPVTSLLPLMENRRPKNSSANVVRLKSAGMETAK